MKIRLRSTLLVTLIAGVLVGLFGDFLASAYAAMTTGDTRRIRWSVGSREVGLKISNILSAYDEKVTGATYTVAAESANCITTSVQFTDEDAANMATIVGGTCYLLANSAGTAFPTTVPSGGVTAGTDGAVAVIRSNGTVFVYTSESDGDLDVKVCHNAGDFYYLGCVMPNGDVDLSSIIDFAP